MSGIIDLFVSDSVRSLLLARAVFCQTVEPICQLAVPPDLLGQLQHAIAARPPAFVTGDDERVDLFDKVTRRERAVAGHDHLSTFP